MANLPRAKRMSWQPERKAQEGRKVTNPFYHTTAWRKCRAQYIQENPLCELCLKEGKSVAGKVVDHIVPINPRDAYDTMHEMYGEPLDPQNLQTLCEGHHAQKSGKERHAKR